MKTKNLHIKALINFFPVLLITAFLFSSCKKENPELVYGILQLVYVRTGNTTLNIAEPSSGIPVSASFNITFTGSVDTASVRNNIIITALENSEAILCDYSFTNENKTILLLPRNPFRYFTTYKLTLTNKIKGSQKETFTGAEYQFTTENGKLQVLSVLMNGQTLNSQTIPYDIDFEQLQIDVTFSDSLPGTGIAPFFVLMPNVPVSCTLSDDHKKVTIRNNQPLLYYKKYAFQISSMLHSIHNFSFQGYNHYFITSLDSTYKMPLISDEDLLTLVQRQTFEYFYDFAHPACGMARERNTSGDVVTTGGSGFGVMALIVGMERGFITRTDGLARLDQILDFLETCDRFHGAWPHWLNGNTGQTIPFSPRDDGGDLVETSFMIQGLITMRQYLDSLNTEEKNLINRINVLSNTVEYDWFTQGQNVLYWHWSPNTGWEVNLKLEGYNETLITYVLAASSTTHTIPAEAFTQGYMRNGAIVNGNSYYGYILPLGYAYGGPLFFTHYSFLGLDPRNLQDVYASYWQQNVNQSLINQAYCAANPHHYASYSMDCWGLTASDNHQGYSAHSPTNDLGVIAPTAALSAFAYTPEASMKALKHFYYHLGDRLWGEYGFYDAFSVSNDWWANSYISIDQGPIIIMIENYRTGLCWNLFMSAPEVQQGLTKLGFNYAKSYK